MPDKNTAETYKDFAIACRICDVKNSPDEAAQLLKLSAHLVERLLEEKKYKDYGERISELETRISVLEKNINKPENKKSAPKKSTPKNTVPDKNFDKFWAAYPKKVAKQNAHKAWIKIGANDELTETIISALEQHKKSQQWLSDGGQFIPNPATWLNGRQWEDELFQGISGSDKNEHSYDLDKLTKYAMEHTPKLN